MERVIARHARRVVAQQVGEVDFQLVADVGAQHQRARPLVGPQRHLAGRGHHAGLVQRLAGDQIDHVALERVDHAVGVERAEAVVDDGLVERDHIGHHRARAPRLNARRERHQPRAQERAGAKSRLAQPGLPCDLHLAASSRCQPSRRVQTDTWTSKRLKHLLPLFTF